MIVILSAIIPVGLIILIGFIAGRILRLEVNSLSQTTVYILAPALVLDGLYRTTLSLHNTAKIWLGFALISALLYGLVWILAKLLRLSPTIQKSLIASSISPNNGNMGLPMADYALGAAGLERAIIYMIGSTILLFGLLPALLKGKGIGYGLRLSLKLPLIWAMFGGVGLRLFSIQLPFGIAQGIEELGRASIPLALIILGMQLASTRFEIGKDEVFAVLMRLGVAPIIAYGVGKSLGLDGLDLQVLILQSAMPTAVTSVVLVTEFGGDASLAARTVVVTTLCSFLTLPLLLLVLLGI